MNCIKCNKEIENGAKFCTFCGATQDEEGAPNVITVVPAVKKKDAKKEEKKAEKLEKKEAKNAKKQTLPQPKQEKAPKEQKAEKAPKEQKAEKAPKSKDRVNFFLLMLTLLCPPYFGVLITVCQSAKKPKASQVYGIFTILSFIFMKVKNYVLTVVFTLCVIFGALAVVLQGAYLVLTELGYDISFVTNSISGFFNF